jgi:nicotinamidase-related amidase
LPFLTTLAQRVDPNSAALIVLDMVKDPGSPPSMEIARLRNPLGNLVRLVKSAHRVGFPVIYVKNSYSDWVLLDNWKEGWSRRADYSPRRYAEGVELHDGLEVAEGDAVMIKRYYSAFAHGPLDLMLRCRGIKSVLLTGGAVLGAVESAAKESYVRGYYLVLVSDCVVPDSGPDHEIVMKHGSGKLGAIMATAEEIMRHWDSLAAGKKEREP